MVTLKMIKNVFKTQRHFNFKPPEDSKESAVIIPFVELNGAWHLIFEKKVNDNSKHAGQVAFPGGSKDEQDKNFLETAIRETCEEIGVCENDLEILGEVEPTVTLTTNFVIYPFAAIVKKPPPYKINRSEVEKLIFVPLQYLIDKHPFPSQKYIYKGKERITMVIEYDGEIIWGATARILNNLIPLFL